MFDIGIVTFLTCQLQTQSVVISFEIYDKFCQAHEIYADWSFLQSKKYVLNKDFSRGEGKCPIPEKLCDNYGYCEEIPLKTLFKSKKRVAGIHPRQVRSAKVHSPEQSYRRRIIER